MVIQYPADTILELGTEGYRALDFIETFDADEFAEWSKSLVHCKLCENDIVWVPYGWAPILIALPPQSHPDVPISFGSASWALTMALVSKTLVERMNPDTRTLIQGIVLYYLRMIRML